jgi:hypothetical protein
VASPDRVGRFGITWIFAKEFLKERKEKDSEGNSDPDDNAVLHVLSSTGVKDTLIDGYGACSGHWGLAMARELQNHPVIASR